MNTAVTPLVGVIFSSKLMHATVDKVEVKKLFETFMELSNGGKESLDKDTFKKGLNKLEQCGLKNIDNTPFADRLFHLLDVNGDGTVDLSEFVCGLSMLCKGTVEEKLECMLPHTVHTPPLCLSPPL